MAKSKEKVKQSKIDKLYGPKRSEKKGSTSEENADLLRIARERADEGATYWKDTWELAEEDLRFLSGDQWPEQVRTERAEENRPVLTNNVLPTFVDRIVGDQRKNKPSIMISGTNPSRVKQKVVTEDGQEVEEEVELKISNINGTKEYSLAQVMQGVIRGIEYNCDAEDAYDESFQAEVESSLSYLRVRGDYVADDTFEQDLLIEAIENQFSVIIDPSFKKAAAGDMNWCLIDEMMDKDVFEKEYPGKASEPIDSRNTALKSWFTGKKVRVSEYFVREPIIREMALMSDGKSYYMDEIEDVIDELIEQNVTIERTRKVKTYKVIWRKITGHDVLEGPIELPCTTIPVVPVFGKKISIKGERIYRSFHRNAHDAQRQANYWDSASTESVALAPKAPFIASVDQIEGHPEWQDANTKNYSVLTYTKESPADPGPKRSQPASIPAAEISLAMRSTDKIKSTIGMFDASLGAASNETSGVAIENRQRETETSSFVFLDNHSKSVVRVGRLLIEMIPTYYDTERVTRMLFEDGSEDFVKLNEKILDKEKDEWITINDLSVGKYDVVVKTGPAYATQRQQAADSLLKFAAAVPASAAVIGDLVAKEFDWPGSERLASRLQKMIPPEFLTAEERKQNEEDKQDIEEKPLTPDQELAMRELDVREKEAVAKEKSAEADIAEAEADVIKAQLETKDAQDALKAIEGQAAAGGDLANQVRELVAQAIAEITAQQN